MDRRDGGRRVLRLALTEFHHQGRDQFIVSAKEIECTVWIGAIGDIFARRTGLRCALPSLTAGNHIDTQPTSGKFDCNCGVLAVLTVLRTLAEAHVHTIAPFEVAVSTNGEGSHIVAVVMVWACSSAHLRLSMR